MNSYYKTIREMQKHVNKLRALYISGTPRKRLNVGKQLINYDGLFIQKLIFYVSAIEGTARSGVLNCKTRLKNKEALYLKIKKRNAIQIVKSFFKIKKKNISKILKYDWKFFKLAVDYRNLILHEATFLRQGYSQKLIESCKRVLAEIEKVL